MKKLLFILTVILLSFTFISCGDDENESDKIGIAGECKTDADCKTDGLTCLLDFKGGYCGVADCTKNADCPESSLCVTENSKNYCFRSCTDKVECNANRSTDNEANCSASFNLANQDDTTKLKACLPPSN
jgi:hypothetical protein